jgi:hypothetical protein
MDDDDDMDRISVISTLIWTITSRAMRMTHTGTTTTSTMTFSTMCD